MWLLLQALICFHLLQGLIKVLLVFKHVYYAFLIDLRLVFLTKDFLVKGEWCTL